MWEGRLDVEEVVDGEVDVGWVGSVVGGGVVVLGCGKVLAKNLVVGLELRDLRDLRRGAK